MNDTSRKNKPSKGVDLAVSSAKTWGRSALSYTARLLFRVTGELTAVILGFGMLWCYMMSTLLAQKSLNVSAFEPNIAMWFSKAFDGRSADIGNMAFRWRPEANSLTFEAADIDVKDDKRDSHNKIAGLQAGFDFGQAMRGKFTVKYAKVSGGSVTWKRDELGGAVMGFGTPKTVGQFITLPGNGGETEAQPQLNGSENWARRPFSIGGLDAITIDDATVYVIDAVNGIDLQFQNTDVNIERQAEQFSLETSTQIDSGDDGSKVALQALFSPDYEDFEMDVSVENLNPSAVAPSQGQMAQANRVDAAIDLSLQIGSARGTGLNRASLELSVGPGTMVIGEKRESIRDIRLVAAYDPERQVMDVKDANIEAGKFALQGSGQFTNIGRPAVGFLNAPVGFKAELSLFEADFTDAFENVFTLKPVVVEGGYDPNNGKLVLNNLTASFPSFDLETRLEIDRDNSGKLTALAGNGRIAGDLTPEELLGLWPTEFVGGARRWIERSILQGLIEDVDFNFSLDEEALAGQALGHEDLTVRFKVRNGNVRYISTMTPLTNVSGIGVLHGNSFEIEAFSGEVGELQVSRAFVSIPVLRPKGADFTIEAKGRGDVTEMLSIIDQKPFEFVSRYNVDPKNFAGTGDIDLTITRPLLEFFDPDRIQYQVSGDFTDVTVPFSIGDYQLEDGRLSMQADRTRMTVNGPVKLGPWEANLEWEQPFSENPGPTIYRMSGLMDRDTLNGFGIGLRKYFGGQFQVDIDAQGKGLQISAANLEADLTNAELRIGEYWSKEPGAAANLTGLLSRAQDGVFSARDIKMRAPGLSVDGQVAFAQDMRLIDFELNRAQVDEFIDGYIKVAPSPDLSAFDVLVAGDYLDISPFVAQAIATPAKSGITFPINLTAELDRLILGDAFILENADLEVFHNGTGTQRGHIKGKTVHGDFRAEITQGEDLTRRALSVDIPNASHAVSSLIKLNSLKGGRLQLTSSLPAVGADGPVQGTLLVDDFVLVNAPVFAQILSLASLKGLSDAMIGSGLNFDELELPFSYEKGALSVRDGRASGPALGLTGSGDVDIGRRLVDVDGVLVPAYTTNSALADIPVIGDIFVGKKGEGIFALSYSVRGPFKTTQVSVNPFSALTPGFLRRIFDAPREGLPAAQGAQPAEAEQESAAE